MFVKSIAAISAHRSDRIAGSHVPQLHKRSGRRVIHAAGCLHTRRSIYAIG